MRLTAILFVALAATPVAAACPYVSVSGSSLNFSNDGENTVIIEHANGQTEICSWARSDEGTGQNIVCDDGSKSDMERMGDAISFRKVRWVEHCAEWDDDYNRRFESKVHWSRTSFAPHDTGEEVTRVETLNAWLVETDGAENYFEITLTSGIAYQDLTIMNWLGGDGFTLLEHRFQGAALAKIGAQRGNLYTLAHGAREPVRFDWRTPTRIWSEARYRNPDVWEDILRGAGPIPWDRVEPLLQRYDEQDGGCRGSGLDEAARIKACDTRDALGRELGNLDFCIGREDEYGYQFEWHVCGDGSYRYE